MLISTLISIHNVTLSIRYCIVMLWTHSVNLYYLQLCLAPFTLRRVSLSCQAWKEQCLTLDVFLVLALREHRLGQLLRSVFELRFYLWRQLQSLISLLQIHLLLQAYYRADLIYLL